MKKWKILYDKPLVLSTTSEVVDIIFQNRDIKKNEREKFLNPQIQDYSIKNVGIDEKEFERFKKRIEKAFKNKERIIIFGDYDVDGICASAILWETLFARTNTVVPYIPDRADEGYGISKKGIDNVLEKHPDTQLIITVDNGIVAYDAISYANEKGIDVIVTDHHVQGSKTPQALCILHTTSLCGAGIAWIIAKELAYESAEKNHQKLELACLATVADLVPLTNANRAIVKEGIEILKNTKRPGLIELMRNAAIESSSIGVYTIGHIIAPRLNATGRIQSAMNALRLICTPKVEKAKEFAQLLGEINRERQEITLEAVEHAKLLAIESSVNAKITIVAHESYNQGIIGLVASQLVESYYKPSFAIAKGEKISKGSARSIKGVNIIELLRSVGDTLLEAGGHPMAAGFSVETHRIEEFILSLTKKAEEIVTDELLERTLIVDMELSFQIISKELVSQLSKLEPFGMANPEPVFVTRGVDVLEVRKIGREQNHLKMKLGKDRIVFDAIGFRLADKVDVIAGDLVDIAYTVEENVWNGRTSLQLKLKDIRQN